LYWDYGHIRKQYKQALRAGDYKAVRNGADSEIELYDLKKDPGETNNIADQHSQTVAKMERLMKKAVTPCPNYPIGHQKYKRKKLGL
jgi:hypothetical protein